MGRMGAVAMAEATRDNGMRRAGLEWHIRANHFPALPMAYVDVAENLLDWLEGQHPMGDWAEQMIDLPFGLDVLPRGTEWNEDEEVAQCAAGTLVDALHLDGFIEWDEEAL
jgi:hypothetical protein